MIPAPRGEVHLACACTTEIGRELCMGITGARTASNQRPLGLLALTRRLALGFSSFLSCICRGNSMQTLSLTEISHNFLLFMQLTRAVISADLCQFLSERLHNSIRPFPTNNGETSANLEEGADRGVTQVQARPAKYSAASRLPVVSTVQCRWSSLQNTVLPAAPNCVPLTLSLSSSSARSGNAPDRHRPLTGPGYRSNAPR